MPRRLKGLKVAIVVEELTQLGGAERVFDHILELFPKAQIFTLVWDKEKTEHRYDKFNIKTSFIQRMPFGVKRYKWYLPLMPLAVTSFDLSKFNLIISITSALAKGVKTSNDQVHICYCNTPTRYLWLDYKSYIKTAPIPFFIRPLMPIVLWFLRKWDLKASKRPNYFIANSENVRKRIKKIYGRESIVITPAVDWKKAGISQKVSDYYLLVSRIEPYKKVDLVIAAFNQLPFKLKIIGQGTKKEEIEEKAKENIEFLGRLADKDLNLVYANAKAVIFPQEEDFGLIPIESMAAGRPVIAYKKGGALETIIEGKTGEFFYPQTAKALKEEIMKFNFKKYKPSFIREYAKKFDKSLFKKKILDYTISKLKEK